MNSVPLSLYVCLDTPCLLTDLIRTVKKRSVFSLNASSGRIAWVCEQVDKQSSLFFLCGRYEMRTDQIIHPYGEKPPPTLLR